MQRCPHAPCTCEPEAGRRYCSDHCEKAHQDGRLQPGPCHCGHPDCG